MADSSMKLSNEISLKVLLCAYYEKDVFDECTNITFDQQAFSLLLDIAGRNHLKKSFRRFISNRGFFLNASHHYDSCIDDQTYEWFNTLKKIVHIVGETLGERYVLIKLPLNPWRIDVSDVDICLCNPKDVLSLSKKLEEEGYELYGFRLLTHPLKTLAIRTGNTVSIDLYYGIRWLSVKPHDCRDIYLRRKKSEYYGLNIITPNADDDLYIRATHAYYHGEIPLADILQGMDLIAHQNFDVDYLITVSKRFGMTIPLLIYLLSMSFICDLLQCKSLPLIKELISALYKESNPVLIEKIPEIKKLRKKFFEFPVRISTISLTISTIMNAKSIKYADFLSLYYTLQAPFLIKISKLIKG